MAERSVTSWDDGIVVVARGIATETIGSAELAALVTAMDRELGELRNVPVSLRMYMDAVGDVVDLYVASYLRICAALDAHYGLNGGLESHLGRARDRAGQVAAGLWQALTLMPALRSDGAVDVQPDGRFKPVKGVKERFEKFGFNDISRARALAILRPEEVPRDAPFNRTAAGDRADAAAALSSSPASTAASPVLGAEMALRTLVRLVRSGKVEVGHFTLRVVRARLPKNSTRRQFALAGRDAGADELTLEVIASCVGAGGETFRLRIFDLPLDPQNEPMPEVGRLAYESLERIDRALPEAPKLVVFPELLPLGPPRSGRDVTVSKVASAREADHMRAAPENRRCAAALLVEAGGHPPHGWTIACLASRDRGSRLDMPALQAQIRATYRSAELCHTRSEDGLREAWLVSTQSNYVSDEQTEAVADLLQDWERGPASTADEIRRAGHRTMYHGNLAPEVVEALTQVNLTYTMAEELG